MATALEYFNNSANSKPSSRLTANDYFSLDEKELKKRKAQQDIQDKIEEAQRKAAEANAQVAGNTASNLSLLEKTKRFGKEAAVDATKGVVSAIASPFTYTAEGTARALGAGNESSGQPAADVNLEAGQQRILELLRDPKIPKARKDILLSVLNDQNRESALQATQQTQDVEKATNKRRFVASAYETGLTPFAVGGATQAGQIAAGVGFGTLGALQQEELTPQSIALGAFLGAAIPALGAGAQLASKAGRGASVAENVITDEARLLPAKAGRGADVITNPKRLLAAAEQNPKLAVISKGASLDDVNRLNDIDRQIMRAQQTGEITVTEAKGLLRERKALVTKIQNPESEIGQAVKEVDTKLSQATDPREVKALTRDKEFIQQQALLDARNKMLDDQLGDKKIIQVVNNKTKKKRYITPDDAEYSKARAVIDDNRIENGADSVGMAGKEQPNGDVYHISTKTPAHMEANGFEPSTLTKNELNPLSGNQKVAGQAQSTEARAIKAGLADDIEKLGTYGSTTWDDQADAAIKIMDSDFEAAKRIALGLQEPPSGVLSNAVYKGVENRAIQTGDSKLIAELAQSATGGRTSRAAQELGILGYKDPESPITALKAIGDARKSSALSIPADVLSQEAEQVTKLSKTMADAKTAALSGGDRMAYGRARIAYDNYVNDLIEKAGKKGLKESLKHPVNTLVKAAGVPKSIVASLDNSALGRQGWKTLFTHPRVWAKNSLKSFQDIARTLGGKEVMDEVSADLVSRPNSLNGLYKQMKLDVYGTVEEAFPSSLPEKIPGVGRAFKASEAAYTGFLQRTRADLADQYLDIARKAGVDLASEKELQSIGKMVNSLTSRGHLGRVGERSAKVLNNVFFSPRLLKSNLDILGGHVITGAGGSNFVRKQAAKNLLKMGVGAAAVLKLADEVKPGSVEWDSRSADFGKVRVGDTRFDVTGGLSGLLTLFSRVGPALPGVPGTPSSKSSTTGLVKKLNTGEFGSQTTADVLTSFMENKFSPIAGVLRDHFKGETFEGNKPTNMSDFKNLTVPLIYTTYDELKNNPRAADVLPSMIAEGLGISTNTYSINTSWDKNPGKELQGFRSKVGAGEYKKANEKFNNDYNAWLKNVLASEQYQKLAPEDRQSLLLSKKDALKEDIFESYNYKYKQEKRNNQTKDLIKALSNL